VPDLAEQLTDCFRTMRLPSECGLPWARAGKSISIAPFAPSLDVTISQVARPVAADRSHGTSSPRLTTAPRAGRA
jgi:hypothetical protein